MSVALPTFSSENILRGHLLELNCSATFLAGLAGISQSKLSQCLNGTKSLTAEESAYLLDLTKRLMALRQAFGIVPLELSNVKSVRALLDVMDEKGITTEQVRETIRVLFHQ